MLTKEINQPKTTFNKIPDKDVVATKHQNFLRLDKDVGDKSDFLKKFTPINKACIEHKLNAKNTQL